MRDQIKKVNEEQDKLSTFQTPLPNPRFNSQRRLLDGSSQQKVIGGIVV